MSVRFTSRGWRASVALAIPVTVALLASLSPLTGCSRSPRYLRGRGGALRTGRLFDFGGRRHSDLLGSIAHAMGDPTVQTYGQGGQGLLPGLLV